MKRLVETAEQWASHDHCDHDRHGGRYPADAHELLFVTDGICAVFGLRYHLTETIPKLGGHTCRIDVRPITRPITLKRGRDEAVLA